MNSFSVKSTAICLLLAATLSACTTPTEHRKGIIFISTNDIHGAIDRFPQLATLVDRARAQDTMDVILVDGGDRWTGNPFVDNAPEAGQPIIKLMNEVGYDVATLGNHEYDYGVPLLAERMADYGFAVPLANLRDTAHLLPPFEPYLIRQIAGVNVGFIALTPVNDRNIPEGTNGKITGLEFVSPSLLDSLYRAVRSQCDLLVGVTHIGLKRDEELAQRFPYFDLIIGGHTHDSVYVGYAVNNTVITQAGGELVYAGLTTVLPRNDGGWAIDNRLVRLDSLPAQPKCARMVERINDEPELKAVIGHVKAPFDREQLACMIADIARERFDTDIAFQNLHGVRIMLLPEGDFIRADIYRITPASFNNSIVTFSSTLGRMRDLILWKYNFSAGPPKEHHTLDLCPSGIDYRVITADESDPLSDGVEVEFFGRWADKPLSTPLTVAMNDYIYMQYLFDKCSEPAMTDVMTYDLLGDYVVARGTLIPDTARRVLMPFWPPKR